MAERRVVAGRATAVRVAGAAEVEGVQVECPVALRVAATAEATAVAVRVAAVRVAEWVAARAEAARVEVARAAAH